MSTPLAAKLGRVVVFFVLGRQYLLSDSHGASLGSYTFALILVARHARPQLDRGQLDRGQLDRNLTAQPL